MVTYKPRECDVAPEAEEVPILHSSSFKQQERRSGAAETPSSPLPSSTALAQRSADAGEGGELSGNAFEWAMKRADRHFDSVEADGEVNATARAIVTNPATQGALKAMQACFLRSWQG